MDGAVAALRAGSVTELDLVRIFDDADDRPVVAELRPGEFRAAVDAYEAISNPRARNGDQVWWNWCRMPAGTSAAVDDPKTVAVMPPSRVVTSASGWAATSLTSQRTWVRGTRWSRYSGSLPNNRTSVGLR